MERISSIAERLKEYRLKNKYTLSDLSMKTGIPAQTLNRYELAQRAPKIDTAVHIADCLGVNPLWLQGYDVSEFESPLPSNAIPFTETHMAPIVGTIPAGFPALAFEDIEGYASIPYSDTENYFFLRVKGDSMINAGINSGDLVLIRRQACAEDGQIVAARVNGDESTLKRFRQQGDTVFLLPENSSYPPTMVNARDFESGEAQIIGIAIEVRHIL